MSKAVAGEWAVSDVRRLFARLAIGIVTVVLFAGVSACHNEQRVTDEHRKSLEQEEE